MRQASVERYLIGVRPVLINVFVDDLVEIWVADHAGRSRRRPVQPSLPSRKPVREPRVAMLSSRRSCH
ncbi:transposase [Burkholderia sp. IT-111MI5]